MNRTPAAQRPAASVDAELLTLCAEFQQVDARLMELNAEIKADTTDAASWEGLGAGIVHGRWWQIVDKVIDTPAFTVPGWAAKGSVFPPVLREVASLDSTTADHRLALSLVRDLTGQEGPRPDAELIAACAAFDAAHAETKAPRGETDADDEVLARAIERWYVALYAAVAIPARTAAGQQAKVRVVYTALWDALKDEPICGHKEEFAALRVLAELIGADDLVLPAEDPEPAAAPTEAPAEEYDLDSLLAAAEDADSRFYDMESVFLDMRADIEIIKHVARTEAEVSVDAWVRIHDHLDLACDTLESSWGVAKERRHALSDALKAERAERKALERARIDDAQPGSPADIEDAEALWTFMQNISRMVLKRHDDAAAAA